MITEEKSIIYELVRDFPDLIYDAYFLTDVVLLKKKPRRIVLVGMGGSYIAALVFKEFFKNEVGIPIEVCNSSDAFVDENTLSVLLSYSGNSKEVLEYLRKYKKGNYVAITSGGKLESFMKKRKMPVIKVPTNMHDRFTFAHGLFPLIKLFEGSGLLRSKKQLISRIISLLEKNSKKIEGIARELAVRIKGKTLIVYSSNNLYPAAYRMQTSIEEDSKRIVHSNRMTELFHNELNCLYSDDMFPILIIDKKEMKSNIKQIAYLKKVLGKYYEVEFDKYGFEERMMLIFHLVDYLGYHLSLLYGTMVGEYPKSEKIKGL